MDSNLLVSAGRVGIVLLIGLGSAFVLRLALKGIEKRARRFDPDQDHLKRTLTALQVMRSLGIVLIVLIVGLMALTELGIDIAPVLASAGVVGLAFSLGAQTIIKDYLGGLIILAEDQFKIGDTVAIGEFTGVVEKITLRLTYLRDNEGKLHLVPNGEIRALSNLTSQWSQVLLTLNLEYEADLDQTVEALETAIRRVQADEKIAPDILEAPRLLCCSGFTDWAVQSQIQARTRPGQQWQVGRALRKAALLELHAHGLRLATPLQRVENLPEKV